ncbi:hypothetical protein HYH03_010016 [Edaphochlamys debaryana]|uniref:Uncharacterized protein n=1 Tax=Edaphochlamys debaryana TaxID=47281 RepID=A0A835Y063_9CHLO|nr:hypothetical protein HYH03_010016 [Edaphochlamys debaryana]|eukprot:KAG2491646.1 hypothetical protein HYH03_010016 [Edaphochlamys debaryana]
MSKLQDEVDALHADIRKFLAEEGADSGDDDDAAPSVPIVRARPGSITPMGVRVDRGPGLLGQSTATETLGEMDSVLSNIRSWKQKHERDMLEMRQRAEAAMGDTPSEAKPNGIANGSGGAHDASSSAGVLLPPEEDLRQLLREAQAQPDGPGAERVGPAGARLASVLAQRSAGRAAAATTVGTPAQGPVTLPESIRAAAAAAASTPPLARPASAAAKAGSAAADAALLRGQQLMAELEAELAALGLDGADLDLDLGLGPHLEEDAPGTSATAAAAAGPRPRSAARGPPGAGAGAAAAAGGALEEWSVALQGVLAKMDALQTGYQATAMAGSGSGSGSGAAAAGGGGGAGAVSAPPRPASGRLTLDPLPGQSRAGLGPSVGLGGPAVGLGGAALGLGAAAGQAAPVPECAGHRMKQLRELTGRK